jgi:putative transposase
VTQAKESIAMKKSRFTEEKIIGILNQAGAGMTVSSLCRQHGISDATFYKWRSKFGGTDVSEARRLRGLEEENQRLKPAERRLAVRYAIDVHGYSERRACQLMEMNRRTFRRPPGPDRDAELRIRLRGLAEERRHFGSPRLQILLRREGIIVNHKRVERVYREEGLSLRLKHRRKRASHLRVVPPGPTGPNQHWAMDFVSDCLISGRRLRMLTVVDLYDRCCPVIEVDHSLTGERVARVLERLNVLGQCPAIIRIDNGVLS